MTVNGTYGADEAGSTSEPAGAPDCCAICGAEPWDEEGRPGCGCAARAAEREAALDAFEGFSPLRVRPYVAEPPEGEPEPSAALPLLPASDFGSLAVEQLPPEPPGLPDESLPGRGRRARRFVLTVAGLGAAALALLGATQVTSVLASPDRGERVSADDLPTALQPTTAAASASASASKEASSKEASPSPSTSARGPERSAPGPAATSPSEVTTAPASRTPKAPSVPTTTASGRLTPTTTPTSASTSPDDEEGELREGDQGPEVVELQSRLKQTGSYTGDTDGTFDAEVREGVTRFQTSANVQGDKSGVYGANTRKALEAQTSL